MGVDDASRKIYSDAHIAVHIFGTASSVAVCLFVLKRGKRVSMTVNPGSRPVTSRFIEPRRAITWSGRNGMGR